MHTPTGALPPVWLSFPHPYIGFEGGHGSLCTYRVGHMAVGNYMGRIAQCKVERRNVSVLCE